MAQIDAVAAQDIAGIEDCTKTAGLDRRTGCLQANVNFLQRILMRDASEAQRRLQAAESEIGALKTALAALRKQLDALQAAKIGSDKALDDKAAAEKKK
ncbi:hypothetical protein [Bradyrhizobium sp.]|uniref:hypothetical protein n=1 Tax=Bradyrhizobium sp. TaxID=376 RepID=UPI0025C1C82D|nr:hypothetical protein [Bradyrhizobium sp.]